MAGIHDNVDGARWKMFKYGSNAQGRLKKITRPRGYDITIKLHYCCYLINDRILANS